MWICTVTKRSLYSYRITNGVSRAAEIREKSHSNHGGGQGSGWCRFGRRRRQHRDVDSDNKNYDQESNHQNHTPKVVNGHAQRTCRHGRAWPAAGRSGRQPRWCCPIFAPMASGHQTGSRHAAACRQQHSDERSSLCPLARTLSARSPAEAKIASAPLLALVSVWLAASIWPMHATSMPVTSELRLKGPRGRYVVVSHPNLTFCGKLI